jgi:hypothetical protein
MHAIACVLAVCALHVHVVNTADVPIREVQAFEAAAVVQARQLRSYWGTPLIRFDQRGWMLSILRPNDPLLEGDAGFHSYDLRPYARVEDLSYWTVLASHELMEMLADPKLDTVRGGYLQEVADPVRLLAYRVDGVEMSDFVTPDWFDGSGRGPLDFLERVRHPGSILYGHAARANPATGAYREEIGRLMREGREAPILGR